MAARSIAGPQLGPVERLGRPRRACARASGDVLDPLVGRVAAPAREALAPAPDRAAFVGDARVDDLVVVLPAVRTPHDVHRTVRRPPRSPCRERCAARQSSSQVIVSPGQQRGGAARLRRARRPRRAGRRRARARCGDRPQRVAGLRRRRSATCGRRSGVAREDPPSAAPARATVSTRPRPSARGDERAAAGRRRALGGARGRGRG